MEMSETSRTTVANRLNELGKYNLVKINRVGKLKYYKLDLEQVDNP